MSFTDNFFKRIVYDCLFTLFQFTLINYLFLTSLCRAQISLIKVSGDLHGAEPNEFFPILTTVRPFSNTGKHWSLSLFNFFFCLDSMTHIFLSFIYSPLATPLNHSSYPPSDHPQGLSWGPFFIPLYILSLSNLINFCGFKYYICVLTCITYTIL